jgi:hypothetical protein
VHRLYRGSLRVLLVLLHDFPEFLCDYHYGFCDVIPPNCIQVCNFLTFIQALSIVQLFLLVSQSVLYVEFSKTFVRTYFLVAVLFYQTVL